MNDAHRRSSPIQRQVEAYEESWTQAHQEAMACRDCEDTIAVGSAVFRLLESTNQSWRERVFRGIEEFSPEYDDLLQGLFRAWLHVTDHVLAEVAPLERRFGVVERAGELGSCANVGRHILATWTRPRLSAAVGLRETELTPEAASELDRILEEAKPIPPPPSSPKMPEMAAAEFRRRKQS